MSQKRSWPDLILINGDIYTQDPLIPLASAVAIGEGRILAVGDRDATQSMHQNHTKVIDLGGQLVLPGMTDAHFHCFEWALNRQHLALANVTSFDHLRRKVESWVNRLAPGNWVIGQGWNEADWPEPRMPLCQDLDAISPHNPVVLWRCDLHLAAVNSLALKAAGIQDDTPDPKDGLIERDENGRPTGILRELAINLVRDAIPSPSDPEATGALKDAVSELHRLGITGIHDTRLMNDQDGDLALRAWQHLDANKDLDLRCWVTLAGEQLDEAIAQGLRAGAGNDRLRIGHVKFFADGGMGARTAWLYEPYIDADHGMPLIAIADLNSAITKAESAGLAVMIHAVGDRANGELIRMFEARMKEKNGAEADTESAIINHRIEHVQMIRPKDIPRLARTGVAISVQPHNMSLDMKMIDASVGSRGRWTYAFRDLIDAGIPAMLSSDCPVCDPSPLIGIHAAVTRQRTDGTPSGGWYPESKIRVDEAIRGYTLTPASVHGLSDQLGSITVGKQADLIVLDRNLYTIDPMEIADTAVDMTIFDGRIVYSR